jgi:hypothetical protein
MPARRVRARAGIHILCEVVASNFDLRQCPAPVLKRLHEFSGSTELVEARPVAVRTVQQQGSGSVADAEPGSGPTLMQYLISSHSSNSSGRAAC